MGRFYLILIILGGIAVAMMPSDRDPDRPYPSPGGTFEHVSPSNGRTARIVELRRPRPDAAGAPRAGMAVSGQGITLDRAPDGHFYAEAQVNGTPIHFLIDTGASGVALSSDDARRVGLPFFSDDFAVVGRGASGDVRGKLITLDRVTLGGKSVENVSGAILEGSEMSLLGQSFLARMGTIEITGDKMVIR